MSSRKTDSELALECLFGFGMSKTEGYDGALLAPVEVAEIRRTEESAELTIAEEGRGMCANEEKGGSACEGLQLEGSVFNLFVGS